MPAQQTSNVLKPIAFIKQESRQERKEKKMPPEEYREGRKFPENRNGRNQA
jgi:hypothetical protein